VTHRATLSQREQTPALSPPSRFDAPNKYGVENGQVVQVHADNF
jgi:hypothetical protein